MPEGPEVAYLASYADRRARGKDLVAVKVLSGRYQRHGPPEGLAALRRALPIRVEGVTKKGKVLVFGLAGGWSLVSHLGMTGWWHAPDDPPAWGPPEEAREAPSARPALLLRFGDGTELAYRDPRHFGTLTVCRTPAACQALLDRIAPDVMAAVPLATLAAEVLPRAAAATHRTPHRLLEDALTDQHLIISGVGNYLKAEVLYAARLSPLRTLDSLGPEDWRTLLAAARRTTHRMLGALLRQHCRDYGAYFAAMRVYGRDTDPLGHPVARHRTRTGRTTHWVPAVQS